MTIGRLPGTLPAEQLSALKNLSYPTLGHYLEEGFVDPEIRMLVGSGENIAGTAVTVRTTATDSTALHHAAGLIEPGQVLVLDTGGDRFHAPLGEVVATQLRVRGAAGVIVDGVVTDIVQLRSIGVPVYARGTSLLTTKLLGAGGGGIGFPWSVAGSVSRPETLFLPMQMGCSRSRPRRSRRSSQWRRKTTQANLSYCAPLLTVSCWGPSQARRRSWMR